MVDLAQSAGGPTAPADPQAQRRRKSYMQGLVLLLIVVVLWTASNFLTNALLTTGGYDKPFFVTYANTSSFALYLIPYLVSGKLRRRWRDASSTQQYERLPQQEEAGPAGEEVADDKEELPRWLKTLGFDVPTVTSEGAELVVATEPAPAIKPFAVLAQEQQQPVLASQFTLVWFGANWAINAGLGLTSVASGTTIGSASGFFTLALGAALGVDRFTLPRLGAVCISALGVAAVTFADRDTATSTITPPSSSAILDGLWSRSLEPSTPSFSTFTGKPPNAPLGDLLALLSAFLYSLYVMLLKTRIGSEDRISMPLMFGIVGAINVLCLWPILPLLHFTGVEPFALPPSPRIWAGVVVNMCITFVSDFIYLLAMLKSSPLITTLGLSLTIPLAVVIDAMKGSHTGGTVAVIGSTAVLSSFGFIGWDDHRVFQEEKRRALAIQQVVVAAEERGRGEAGPRSQLREEVGADDRTVRRGDGRDSSAVSLRSASSLTSSGST
uniref:DUF3955 domain-containing protein n=1 Tax=Kalmanozyma brasiliensis (strain GHG001) TaxID=1365824 RepID=V5ECV4_KALBG